MRDLLKDSLTWCHEVSRCTLAVLPPVSMGFECGRNVLGSWLRSLSGDCFPIALRRYHVWDRGVAARVPSRGGGLLVCLARPH